MKKLIITLGAILCALPLLAQPKLTKDNIDAVIKAMTLEEKATLCVGGARAALVDGVTSGQAAGPVQGAAGNTRPIERLGIPMTYLADGPAGLRINPTREGTTQTFYCTGFPVGTLLASSWDVDLVEKVTTAMGNEVLEYGVDVLLAPGVNLHRNPLNGRNFEYFSEDPVLSGNMAAAYIKGVQSNNVGTSIKHYAANNQETNRNEDDAIISARALRELYLKNFEIAIKKGQPWTVMSSYNKLDGKYTQQSEDLLTKVLRDDWGYTGIVMTDWGSKAATSDAAAAGNDLMEPGNQTEIDRLVEAVRSGQLPEAVLDRNVRNMLNYIVKTPAFRKYNYSNKPDLKAHAQVARDAAAESIVLLRNQKGTLPLVSEKNVSLFGIGAINFVAGGTGSGNVNKAYVVNMKEGLTNAGFNVDQGLIDYYEAYIALDKASKALSAVDNRGFAGLGGSILQEIDVPAAAINYQAQRNDVAVIVITRNAGEGADRKVVDDFELTAIERNLINNVAAAFHQRDKRVIVVLNVGGVIETASWKHLADAIILPWSPGQEGANAVGDIIAGKVNPSGKLPMTFPVEYFDHPSSKNFPYNYDRNASMGGRGPRGPVKDVDVTNYEEGIWVGYRFFEKAHKDVSYPFGFGLSYTTFTYSKPTLTASAIGFTATITVTNTGSMAGKEVVELYVSAPSGGMIKPEKELKAFAKTKTLQPGQSQTLSFTVSNYELASFNQDANHWEAAAGNYTVRFCSSSDNLRAASIYKLGKKQSWQVSDAFLNVAIAEINP